MNAMEVFKMTVQPHDGKFAFMVSCETVPQPRSKCVVMGYGKTQRAAIGFFSKAVRMMLDSPRI